MVKHLPGHQLSHVPGAHDDRVLQVVRLRRPTARATSRAPVTTTIPSAQNRRELGEVRIRAARKGRQPGHQKDADGEEQEHPQQIVGGRMIGSLLVAVVEPEELRADAGMPADRSTKSPSSAASGTASGAPWLPYSSSMAATAMT